VNGLLVQDVFAAGSPNRAFWSIAIEVQLYVLLPLLLVLVRRVNAGAMVGMVAAIVVTIGLLGPHVALMNTALVKFIPDLAVLFAVGLLASGIVIAGERTRSRPWAGWALAAAVPAIVLMVVRGSAWSNLNLFWLDLAWAPAIGCFLAAVATSRPRFVVRFLNSRLPRGLGSCSYSLYLTHMPIVIAVSFGLVRARFAPGTARFFVLVAILVPVTVCFARLFAAVFELPFQRHRGWLPLRQAMSARLRQLRGLPPAGPATAAGDGGSTSRASGPRSQAGGRCRPARRLRVADRARPASPPDPPVLPGPDDSPTPAGSC
jgi:peptidoglycan/LPS O-acetylase OafA/YrhL